MNKLALTIKCVDWAGNRSALEALRREVFVEEQHVSPEEEIDGRDPDAIHFLALSPSGHAIGTARLLKSGQIGRMAVERQFRGQGVGEALLRFAVDWALSNKNAMDTSFNTLFLHAQTHAINFYSKIGFITEGEEFMDAGIPHVSMIYAPERTL